MEQMPDEVPDHQGGHYRGTYFIPPSTQAKKQRSRSRYRVSVVQPRLVSEEGGIACTKPTGYEHLPHSMGGDDDYVARRATHIRLRY